jgi:hypothetical protein
MKELLKVAISSMYIIQLAASEKAWRITQKVPFAGLLRGELRTMPIK